MRNNAHNSFRTLVWYASIAALFSLLVIRLSWIQLRQGLQFVQAADDNRYFTHQLPAPRGLIFDRYNDAIAWNERSYAQLEDVTALFPTSKAIDRESALQLLASDSAQVSTKYQRVVAMPAALSPVVGYVGDVTAEDLVKNPSLGYQDVLGKIGLEKIFNSTLQGKNGQDVYEINAFGQRQRIFKHTAPIIGQSIQTSLDPFLSQVAFDALGDKKGAAVIVDTATGEILALVNKPSFDAQILNTKPLSDAEKKQNQQTIQSWFADPRQPFFNRALSGAYPPGSVFKMVTALAGLETKAFTPDTEVLDEGVLKVGEYSYGNWYFRQYGRTEGTLNLVRAIARSNDIYFYKVAEWAGPDAIASMARLLGFGKIIGVELGAENKGLVPDPTWKQQVLKEPWYLGNTYHYGIGQGDILVSPIQVAQYVQAIGNDGTMCSPHLTKNDQPTCHEVGLARENLDIVLEGMLQACSPGGTAYPFFPRNGERIEAVGPSASVKDMLVAGAVACKTGTAEFGAANHQGYRNTHGWFVALVEPTINVADVSEDEPESIAQIAPSATTDALRLEWLKRVKKQGFPSRLAIVVLVESDEAELYQEGSGDASPVAKSILDWIEGKPSLPLPPTIPQEGE